MLRSAVVPFILTSLCGCAEMYADLGSSEGGPDPESLEALYVASSTEEVPAELEETILVAIEENARIVADDEACAMAAGNPFSIDSPPSEDARTCLTWSSGPQEYFSRVVGFAGYSLTSRGLSFASPSGISVSIVSRKELDDVCSSRAAACHRNGHITLLNTNGYTSHLAHLLHEYGHASNSGSNAENTSMTWEIAGPLLAYRLSQQSGSAFLRNAVLLNEGPYLDILSRASEELPVWTRTYQRGTIFALRNLIDHRGNLEAAIDHAQRTSYDAAEALTAFTLGQMAKRGILEPKEVWVALWEELLDQPGFLAYPELTWEQVQEAKDYLNIQVQLLRLRFDPDDSERYVAALERYAANPSNRNPYLRAAVVPVLSDWWAKELVETVSKHGYASQEALSCAKRIIDLNAAYPCDRELASFAAFECPKDVSRPRSAHSDAFYSYLRSAQETGAATEARDIVLSFFETFYGIDAMTAVPGSVAEVDNLIPVIAYHGAVTAGAQDPCLAERLRSIVAGVECLGEGNRSQVSQELCQSYKDWWRAPEAP